MRITNEEIIYELKIRLEKEKSIKNKVQIKRLIELFKEL
jgi:hypothetical protein